VGDLVYTVWCTNVVKKVTLHQCLLASSNEMQRSLAESCDANGKGAYTPTESNPVQPDSQRCGSDYVVYLQ
jgi:hypothetical protein